MLLNQRSDSSESHFKSWNVQVRNAWRVSRETHTYLVENYFAKGQVSLRVQTYTRYSKFANNLLSSPTKEIYFLSKILISDHRSTVSKNVWYLNNLQMSTF